MPPVRRLLVAVLLTAAVFCLPATASASASASAQTSTIPQDGAGVSPTPPVELDGESAPSSPARELPNTGTDARMLFLAGLALTLIGFGLRLRTADADLY